MGKFTNVSSLKVKKTDSSENQYRNDFKTMGRHVNLSNIKVGIRTLPEENVEHNFKSININDLVSSGHKKEIYMFGGNTTTSEISSNGNVKVNEALLSEKSRKNTELYSMSYVTEPFPKEGLPEKQFEDEVVLLFEKTFKPKLYDSDGHIKKKQGIEKVFNNIIFESHCGGAYFVNMIIDLYYDVIDKEYGKSDAENLIKKIQYFTYAPCDLPRHDVNCFVVAPYADMRCTWALMLDVARSQKIVTDYPKGITQKLMRSRGRGTLLEVFDETFDETRAIVSKIGQTTFLIPNAMNPNVSVGDHSIDCISKEHILKSKTDFARTAQLVNYSAGVALDAYEADSYIDSKEIYNKIVDAVKKSPPIKNKSRSDD